LVAGEEQRTVIDDAIGLQSLKAAVDVVDELVVVDDCRAENGVDLGVVLEDRLVVAPEPANPCARPDLLAA
jgi:hypothetical protein